MVSIADWYAAKRARLILGEQKWVDGVGNVMKHVENVWKSRELQAEETVMHSADEIIAVAAAAPPSPPPADTTPAA